MQNLMLCYKNGVFTFVRVTSSRQHIRDALSPKPPGSLDRWSLFNHHALLIRPLGASSESYPAQIALYFPRPEIVPDVQAGTYRYTYTGQISAVSPPSSWKILLIAIFAPSKLADCSSAIAKFPNYPSSARKSLPCWRFVHFGAIFSHFETRPESQDKLREQEVFLLLRPAS